MIPARRSLSFFSTAFSAMLVLSGTFTARAEVLPASSTPTAVLTAEEAVRLGLENNFALALVRDQTALATLSRQTGIGPFLPTASANASHSGSLDSARTQRNSIGVSANLQLFNGFQSSFAYKRLKAQETAATLREDAAVENTVESILTAYYGIAGQKLQLTAIREALVVSEERAKLARARTEVGAGSRLEQLQSQADLNADSSALMSQENALREAKIQLNGLLARDPSTAFDVPDTIPVDIALPVEQMRAALGERSLAIREARAQRRAAELSVSEARGGRLPSINGSLGYSTTPESLFGDGPAPTGLDAVGYNISVSLPLFDGLRTRQSVGSSKIGLRQQETALRQTEQEVRAAYAQAAGRYESGLRQIALEERNLEVARLQAEAARERFRVGSSTSLEFRDAQQTLLNAQSRLATVRQTVKQSELALKRLAGVLASPVPRRIDPMRKKSIWMVSGLVLVAAGGLWWWWGGREEAPAWRTAPLTRGSIEMTVTATGALQAVTTVQVGTQVSGAVAALYADFNSHVKKGQVIARLDTTLLYAALRDALSGQERVAAQERQTAAERTRARSLFERELISQAELEQADAAARVASANLSSARAQVERARINLRYAIIESPIDGIVLSRAVELGQTVAASFNTPTLFTLAGDMREMRVQAAVDEADIGRLREGQAATFTVDAYPDTVFSGVVEQVRLQPAVTQNVVTYDVILRAANPDLRLMPGMTANLTIITDRRDDVLRAPVAALRFRPPEAAGGRKSGMSGDVGPGDSNGPGQGTRKQRHGRDSSAAGGAAAGTRGRIYVLENGVPKAVRVRTGLNDGARTEITDPTGTLKPGAEVIIGVVSTTQSTAPGGAPFGMQQTRGAGGAGGGRR